MPRADTCRNASNAYREAGIAGTDHNDSQHPTCAADLADAPRYLPYASEAETHAFAERQLQARIRHARLADFYREYPCLMARPHLLAAYAITIGRFAVSPQVSTPSGRR